MKTISHYLLFIVMALSARTAFAQAGIITGKVTDAAGKPFWGAVVRVSKDGKMLTEVRTSEDGLYITKPLERGSYQVAVQIEGKELEAKKMFFDAGGVKKYYMLKVAKDNLKISRLDEAAFNEMNLRERRDIEPE